MSLIIHRTLIILRELHVNRLAASRCLVWAMLEMQVSPEVELLSLLSDDPLSSCGCRPSGVNQNVTLDELGGLGSRKPYAFVLSCSSFINVRQDIHPLKEMTLLPLLYTEVF